MLVSIPHQEPGRRPLLVRVEALEALIEREGPRVYTQSHIDYLVEAILEINHRKKELCGFEIVEAPPSLRHFTAKFKPV